MRKFTITLPPEVAELKIPAKLFDRGKYPDLTLTAIFLYAYIASAPKETEEDGCQYVELSAEGAKEVLGCKDTTVRDTFNLLKGYGLIAGHRSKFGGAMRYTIINEEGSQDA